ncbi:hypothetical protein BH11CYA1_BH11CYA1_17450 [soil metagenome]
MSSLQAYGLALARSFRCFKQPTFIWRLCALIVLALFAISAIPAVWADPVAGKLENAQDGGPRITLVSTLDGGKPVEVAVAADAVVFLNGDQVKLSDLKSGDDIKLLEEAGQSKVIATRSKPGIVLSTNGNSLRLTTDYLDKFSCAVDPASKIVLNGNPAQASELKPGDEVAIIAAKDGFVKQVSVTRHSLLTDFYNNFRSNLFKPLLLFFYLGFSIPLLKIAFDFPQQIYQGLTIYLLIAIGWHGGEELAVLTGGTLAQALMFVGVGLVTNTLIGVATYFLLRRFIPKMRRIDSATVAAYYGSDSAGTFVTCLGVLQAAHIAFAAYMPVMLAAMEIPGCLVGLYLVSRLRKTGMDVKGNMPGEDDYNADTIPSLYASVKSYRVPNSYNPAHAMSSSSSGNNGSSNGSAAMAQSATAVQTRPVQKEILIDEEVPVVHSPAKILREVFLNPGIILLFGGILVGFLSRQQGYKVVQADDYLFVSLFQGMLCLFLLEMGMTAARRLKDLQAASWKFVAFALLAPNLFAMFGLASACLFSHAINQPLQLGTYVLFAVLCAAASYIAVPAIQRIAIPEASPTLPLAASLGLTFSYNVTIGIPLYLVLAQQLIRAFPVGL